MRIAYLVRLSVALSFTVYLHYNYDAGLDMYMYVLGSRFYVCFRYLRITSTYYLPTYL